MVAWRHPDALAHRLVIDAPLHDRGLGDGGLGDDRRARCAVTISVRHRLRPAGAPASSRPGAAAARLAPAGPAGADPCRPVAGRNRGRAAPPAEPRRRSPPALSGSVSPCRVPLSVAGRPRQTGTSVTAFLTLRT